ncbi:MAG TPA: helix-turn-helix transcriptional regulator [Alcanivorax sp.]|nr:helix-turn-helix transcriptional regulator [Alcanivorax sp.]
MNKHIGSNFDDFLEEDDILEDCSAAAIKRVITWQIKERMSQAKMTRSDLAKRMNTSRAAVARLLDERDEGMTIDTLSRAARALGSRVEVQFVTDNPLFGLKQEQRGSVEGEVRQLRRSRQSGSPPRSGGDTGNA